MAMEKYSGIEVMGHLIQRAAETRMTDLTKWRIGRSINAITAIIEQNTHMFPQDSERSIEFEKPGNEKEFTFIFAKVQNVQEAQRIIELLEIHGVKRARTGAMQGSHIYAYAYRKDQGQIEEKPKSLNTEDIIME